jgi:predicted nicotinamide N-methyase
MCSRVTQNTMFQETLIQNSPFKGQAIDPITNMVIDISDFVGDFDILEETQDGSIKQWTPITISRQNNLVRSFQIQGDGDSSGSTAKALLLKEYSEAECGIGAGCWLSSIAMLSWLSDNYQKHSASRVLEIGCGVALNSLYLACSHSHAHTNITASDYKHTIGYALDENKVLNGIDTSKVAYEVLDWNQCISETYNPSETIGAFDLIIATDCIYKSTATMFFNVIKHHLAKNGKLLLINPMETSRPGTDNLIYKLAEMGEISVSHIAIQLNKKYTKPLIFVEFTA